MEVINTKEGSKELIQATKYQSLAIEVDTLMNGGKHWLEITTELNILNNTNRPVAYFQYVHMNYLPKDYSFEIDDVEIEKKRAIQELDWVILEATKAYRESLKDKVDSVQEQAYIKAETLEEQLTNLVSDIKLEKGAESSIAKSKGKNVIINKIKGKGDNAYLNTIISAVEKRTKLLGINASKKKEFDPDDFFKSLKNITIQQTNNYSSPIRSEAEALAKSDLLTYEISD